MATTQEDNVSVVERGIEAFNEGNLEEGLAMFAEDVTWHEPESGAHSGPETGGTYHGIDSVIEQLFAPLQELYERFEARPHRYIDGGDTVVVEGDFVGNTAEGTEFEVPFVQVIDVEDGVATRVAVYEDTAKMHEILER